jgi:hypothetical protein
MLSVPAAVAPPCDEDSLGASLTSRPAVIVDPGTRWLWRRRPGPRPRLVADRLVEFIRRYEGGERVAALAKAYNVSSSTAYTALAAAGVRVRTVCERGSHTAETITKAARALELAKTGKLHREIAAVLGVTRARCSQLIALGKETPAFLPARAESLERLAGRGTSAEHAHE